MSSTIQTFFAAVMQKAAEDLVAAFHALPEDRRGWSPGGESRSARNQVAECTILNGYVAQVVQTRTWSFGPNFMEEYGAEHTAVMALPEPEMEARLTQSTARMVEAVQSVSEEELALTIETRWGPWTLERLIGLPYWNMTYHLGQINYIARLP